MGAGRRQLALGALAALTLVACRGDDDRPAASTAPPSTAGAKVPDEACEVITLDDAESVSGVAMQVHRDEAVEVLTSTCTYVSVPPADASEGRILRQLRVDVFAGSQFFDQEGRYYPRDERENVEVGDEGFVHTGDEQRGVTVQVARAGIVYSVNYSEQAILTDEVPDAAARRDSLVAVVEERLGGEG